MLLSEKTTVYEEHLRQQQLNIEQMSNELQEVSYRTSYFIGCRSDDQLTCVQFLYEQNHYELFTSVER
jgi:hypothetical protein